jgi:hypothetical protein
MTSFMTTPVPPQHPWRGIRPWTRHSLVLIVAGFMYVAIGVAYILASPSPSREAALVVALQWMDIHHWGFVFMFVGFLAVFSSRWPPISETWGYMALTGLASGWSGFYAMGVILEHSPVANISGAFLWALVAFLWWAISGLLNPPLELAHVDGRG